MPEMAFCKRQFEVIPKGSFSFKPKSLDYNKSERLVLVAGRKLLKVLTLYGDEFSLHSDLLTKEHESFNCCDAKWSPFADSTLATAEKCSVLIWNLNISQKNKLQREFRAADQRALNKISFSYYKKNVLISGSHDSKIRGFDIHNHKKIFELAYTDEIVRDIQFSPIIENQIGAIYEDGVLAVWDVRRTDQPFLKYQAHTEPAFCLAWHPEQSLIATGGRDRKIRICNIKGSEIVCRYTLHAMNNPVARVAWTQQSANGRTLASISCVGDSFINFWDITKPYSVPCKRSMEQKQFLVDFFCLESENCDLISCSSSGLVMMHSENSAVVMSESINGVSLACNNLGVVQHTFRSRTLGAVNTSLEDLQENFDRPQWSSFSDYDPTTIRGNSLRDRCHSVNIPRVVSYTNKLRSSLGALSSLSTSASHDNLSHVACKMPNIPDPIKPIYARSKEFVQFAQKYKFSNESPMELCKHNEKLSNRLGREDIGFLWYFCQCLLVDAKKLSQGVINLESTETVFSSPGGLKGFGKSFEKSIRYPWEIDLESKHIVSKSIPATPHSTSSSFFDNTELHEQTNLHEKFIHTSDLLASCELEERFETCSPPNKVTDVFSVINNRDLAWWAETDMTISNNKLSPSKDRTFHTTTTPKHLISGEIGIAENMRKSKADSLMFPKHPPMNFTPTLASITEYMVENGEIQHAVYIYLCLHDKLGKQIDPFIFIHWMSCYIDILQSFNLDLVACKIYKFLHTFVFYQEIRNLEDKEYLCTLYDWDNSSCMGSHECKSCEKPVTSAMPCQECNAWPKQLCSVCRLPVYKLCTWCKLCQHGGHREHIIDWFKTEQFCPSGCGHKCVILP